MRRKCSFIEDYAGHTPALDLREYLSGNIEAWGVLMMRSGRVRERFHIAMKGAWDGNDGTLREHFTYADGHKSERSWTVHFSDDNHFTAAAPDVAGVAIGAQFGNAVNLRYVLCLPIGGRRYKVAMDDWMYRMDAHTLINRITMRKFGFRVGELLITFRKL